MIIYNGEEISYEKEQDRLKEIKQKLEEFLAYIESRQKTES